MAVLGTVPKIEVDWVARRDDEEIELTHADRAISELGAPPLDELPFGACLGVRRRVELPAVLEKPSNPGDLKNPDDYPLKSK